MSFLLCGRLCCHQHLNRLTDNIKQRKAGLSVVCVLMILVWLFLLLFFSFEFFFVMFVCHAKVVMLTFQANFCLIVFQDSQSLSFENVKIVRCFLLTIFHIYCFLKSVIIITITIIIIKYIILVLLFILCH